MESLKTGAKIPGYKYPKVPKIGGAKVGMPKLGSMKFKKHKSEKKHKNWIKGAIKHPGALHEELDVKVGHKIPAKTLAKAAKKGGKEGKRARLAETLKKLHHKKGGKHEKKHMKHMKKHKMMCKKHKKHNCATCE